MGRLYPKGTSLSTILNNRKKAEKETKKTTTKSKKESDKVQKIANKKRHGFDITDMSHNQITTKMIDNQETHYKKINETIEAIDTADSDVEKRRKQNVLNNAYKNLLNQSQVLDSLQNTDENYKNAIETIHQSFPESGVASDDEGVREIHKQNIISKGLPINPKNKKVEMTPELLEAFGAPPDSTLTSTKPPSKKEKKIDELLKIIGK